MPVCPECGEEIDCLRAQEAGTMEYYTCLVGNTLAYEDGEFYGDGDRSFECPECDAELFTSERDIADFLVPVPPPPPPFNPQV